MKLYGWLGLLLLIVSEVFLFRRIEPFCSWFYCFAWWSYILLADNLVLRLRGHSLICGRRSELWRMLPISVFFWLLFEGYNLALRNWAYADVPSQLWLRWPAYTLAFATVLPGVFITADLVEYLIFGARSRPSASESEELDASPRTHPSHAWVVLGAVFSAAPLFWPRYFFPAVWLGPIFLLDPALERLGLQNLSLQIARGARRRIWSLLAAGLACGLMWEFWNFWAASRWTYSVPYFGEWKIFEMPLLGFFGFPPFALECWIFYHLFRRLQRRWRSVPARALLWIAVVLYCVLIFRAMDHHTVFNFVSNHYRSLLSWRCIG
jgi:hypothetical protein